MHSLVCSAHPTVAPEWIISPQKHPCSALQFIFAMQIVAINQKKNLINTFRKFCSTSRLNPLIYFFRRRYSCITYYIHFRNEPTYVRSSASSASFRISDTVEPVADFLSRMLKRRSGKKFGREMSDGNNHEAFSHV